MSRDRAALFGGDAGRLLREGGAITHSIDLAPRGAYACMLGGADRKTLYVITNNVGVANEGRIETMRVDVPAAGWP